MTLSNVTLNEDQSTKLDLMSICQRTIKQKKISNVPLDALMCPLPIINWHWTPIIDPSWCKCMLYPPPVQCRKLLNWKPVKQKKQKAHPSYIFLHLSANFGVKIQNTHHYRNWATFLTSHQSALSSPGNGPEVTYSKIQNRLSRPP